MLLFSQMTRALDLIGDTLAALGLPFLRLDGSTKTEQRAAMLTVPIPAKHIHDCTGIDRMQRKAVTPQARSAAAAAQFLTA